MKKLTAICLALVMLLGVLAGCAAPAEEPAADNPTATPAPAPSDSTGDAADMVLKNGVVYTMDSNKSVVSAVAVKGTEIVYVGDDAGVEEYIGDATEVIDLNGKMVTPGFISGHDHVGSELSKYTSLSLFDLEPDTEAYKAAVEQYIADNPDMKVYEIKKMSLKAFEGGLADNGWLNEAAGDKLIVVGDESGHGMLLNDATMEYCGITKDTAPTPGGTFYFDANGELTGYFSDCLDMVAPLDDLASETPNELYEKALTDFMDLANSYGLTAIHDGGSSEKQAEVLVGMDKAGKITMRMSVPFMFNETASFADGTAYAQTVVELIDSYQKNNSDYLLFDSVKTIIDGVPEGKSALLIDPYAPTAEVAPDYRGPIYWTEEELTKFVTTVDAAGYQVLIHSMGDGGCRTSINSFVAAQKANGTGDNRHVVVHATLVDPDDIKLAGANGIYCAMQPVWFYIEPQFGALELQMFGEERFNREYVIRDMWDAGIVMTGSADYSVTPDFRPLSGIEVLATQGSPYEIDPSSVRNADQVVSVYEAIEVYTTNAAKQTHMENLIGSIEVGKKADFVVLGQDITQCDVHDISETPIIYTIFDGEIIYKG